MEFDESFWDMMQCNSVSFEDGFWCWKCVHRYTYISIVIYYGRTGKERNGKGKGREGAEVARIGRFGKGNGYGNGDLAMSCMFCHAV